jgi:hypothetical protein
VIETLGEFLDPDVFLLRGSVHLDPVHVDQQQVARGGAEYQHRWFAGSLADRRKQQRQRLEASAVS